jgi:hypothetical protein
MIQSTFDSESISSGLGQLGERILICWTVVRMARRARAVFTKTVSVISLWKLFLLDETVVIIMLDCDSDNR